MASYRLALGLLILWIVSLVIFVGVSFLPGDIATEILGQSATPETVAAFRRELGLDQPLHLRYLDWVYGIVQGDLGTSLANSRDISELIRSEEHTSELQSLMRKSYAVFCLKKKTKLHTNT